MKVTLEVVVCTADEAVQAEAAGASRIELVSALSEGGLTPSIGSLTEVKARCGIPIVVMIRPRGGGFRYSDAEFSTMLRDVDALLEEGADGIAVGCLTADSVDVERMRLVVHHAQGRPVTFHRAFDLLKDRPLDVLAQSGVTRLLTSGERRREASAEGLRKTVAEAAGRIEVVAAGGLRAGNAREIVRESGVSAVHCGPLRLVERAGPGTIDTAYASRYGLDSAAVREVFHSLSGL